MYFGRVKRLGDVPPPSRPSGPAPLIPRPLPYQESVEVLEREAYNRYTRDCHNVNVLETLERERRSPADQVRFLERKLAAVPRLVEGHRQIARLRDLISRRGRTNRPLRPSQIEAALRGILTAFPELREFPFPPGYAVGSEADERAGVQCQLSRARWELVSRSRHGAIPGRRLR